jgi:glycosyltransferase involved in cell wall biosynthesis
MHSLVLVVPGRLETLTGGYGYDRRIVAGLTARGWSVIVRQLDDSFPRPTSLAREAAARVLASIPDGATVLVDGLALGALPDEARHEAARLRLVALVHHPLAGETGIDASLAIELEASERRALAAVKQVIVTSHATAGALAGYGVDRQRIAVVEPGTDPAPLARGSRNGPVRLLCVAALIPRKGHDVLFRALGSIPSRRWRLTCVGSFERDPATAERLRTLLCAEGLEDRVELAGEMDAVQLAPYYDAADVFVLPTHYEGYGMAVAEALACGLPVVGTATGAIPELVGNEAGIVVPTGDVNALALALTQILNDTPTGVREKLAEGARRVRERLPTWDAAAEKMAVVLTRVSG